MPPKENWLRHKILIRKGRIIIIDEHIISRLGLTLIIKHYFPKKRVAEFGSVSQFLQENTEKQDMNLVLFVLRAATNESKKDIESLKRSFPNIPICLLSTSESDDRFALKIKTDINGYIFSTTDGNSLPYILSLAISHENYSPVISRDTTPISIGDFTASSLIEAPHDTHLTERQIEVMQGVLRGKTNKEIARSLSIFEGTVKAHIRMLMIKFGAKNRTQLATLLAKNGLIP